MEEIPGVMTIAVRISSHASAVQTEMITTSYEAYNEVRNHMFGTQKSGWCELPNDDGECLLFNLTDLVTCRWEPL